MATESCISGRSCETTLCINTQRFSELPSDVPQTTVHAPNAALLDWAVVGAAGGVGGVGAGAGVAEGAAGAGGCSAATGAGAFAGASCWVGAGVA
jgi:hypothetical protein